MRRGFNPARFRKPRKRNTRPSSNRQFLATDVGTSAATGPARVAEIPITLTVKQLANLLATTEIDLIKKLMKIGIMANVNQLLDYKTASMVAIELGFETQEATSSQSALPSVAPSVPTDQEKGIEEPRPPVVTIMGHVNHGKTSLLDAIRQANVMATEAGGITQHIGAYQVEIHGHKITFLDTPGHEAFTAMRARGAQATDIAVLVVAADDGVMPQTKEAIDHARAASVPIVVAINKIDKPNANPQRVKQELGECGLVLEEWGGDVICVEISAKKRVGLEELLENIILVADVSELKASPNLSAKGVVIEAELDKTRGPLVTTLIQSGTLRIGDAAVVGETWGKVKAMFNDKGKRVKKAEPAMPVEFLGLNSVPHAGDMLQVVSNEQLARQIAEERIQARQERVRPTKVISLDDLHTQIREGQIKELNIILKTDVRGSIDPIRDSLEKLEKAQVKVRVIHADTGSITESDVMLAVASKAVIIGFNTTLEPGAKRISEIEQVDIRPYSVIYEIVSDIEKAIEGMLEPQKVEVIYGHAEVRQVFDIGRRGKVAGLYVLDGKITRGARVRVLRQGRVIADTLVDSLKRFKDDVKEVSAGYECGMSLDGFTQFQTGDTFEFYGTQRSVDGG